MSDTCSCGAAIPEGSGFCPKCGKQTGQAALSNPGASAGGMTENVAGGLSYIFLIPAIIFLSMEPYNKNPFVRFHSWQSIYLCIAGFVVWLGYFILNIILGLTGVGVVISLILIPVGVIFFLVFFIAWLLCLIKALGNQKFKLPIIGDLAEKQAGA